MRMTAWLVTQKCDSVAVKVSHFDESGFDAVRMRELLAHLSCPLCGGTRETSLLVVVDGPVENTTVRAQCVRCHLFWSFTLDTELGPTAPVATRQPGEGRDGPITADEVLELHQLLDHLDRPLTEVLWRRAS